MVLMNTRSQMGVNGENMAKKWPKEIHVLELIIDALWLLVAQLENRYIHIYILKLDLNDFISLLDKFVGNNKFKYYNVFL